MRKLNIDKSYTGFNMYHTCGEVLQCISSYRVVNTIILYSRYVELPQEF